MQELSGGQVGRAPSGTPHRCGKGGLGGLMGGREGGRDGGSTRGQGPKGGSTHGVAEAEAGGLTQPHQHRPAGAPRRWPRRDAG